jgi:DNA mismatch endonuclease Vsr
MNKLTKAQRKKNMQAVKSKGSKIEIKLAKELWKRGYRYRKNNPTVFGKPDFTFKKYKIAVFCDSEFWHGKNWETRKKDHKTNVKFWHQKIQRNIERDQEVNEKLLKNGWIILRFWGKEIQKDVISCANIIEEAIENEKAKKNH